MTPMRAMRPLMLLLMVVALAGCMARQGPVATAAPPAEAMASNAGAMPLPSISGLSRFFARSAPAAASEATSVDSPSSAPAEAMASDLPPPVAAKTRLEPARPARVRTVAALPAPMLMPVVAETPYTLDAGDRLRIVVFGQEGLTNSYQVDAGGSVTLPLIGGVPARGTTTAHLSHAIANRLQQGYIREPHVAVEIEAYRPFFILGEVTVPGQYPYVPNMTVETAVAIAGGFTPRAHHEKLHLSRMVNGTIVRSAVPPTTLVRPGDTVSVAERWF
jgi:polysaccharide export outer membrane protein